MQTLNGELCDSYKAVCSALGISQDSEKWENVLSEAFSSLTGQRARSLFATMLVFCELPEPLELFDKFVDILADDFWFRNPNCPFYLLRAFALQMIRKELNAFARKLSDFNLPTASGHELLELKSLGAGICESAVLTEETNFNYENLRDRVQMCCGSGPGSLNDCQRLVFRKVMDQLQRNEQCLLFVTARGGTGKTYTLNAILSAARILVEGRITPAIAMATSGIAAMELHCGRTFHSRFRAHINVTEHSVLYISVRSSLAKLLRDCVLIVWDEAPMAHRYLLEALDRSLRDIMELDRPFGGKNVILAGDFW